MKYQLVLERDIEVKNVIKPSTSKKEDSTLGTILLVDAFGNELFNGYTCENIGPSTDTPKQDKRIVAREYDLEWFSSSKNGSLSKKYPKWKLGGRNKAIRLLCKELPSFKDRCILIHVGNYPQDTEGCILVGTHRNTKLGTISNSIEAINTLFNKIEEIGIENISLLVRDAKASI